jgi:hypothetical protein
MENLDLSKVILHFDGIDTKDYPDFCDAYISGGEYDGRELTEEEIEYLNEHHSTFVYNELINFIF